MHPWSRPLGLTAVAIACFGAAVARPLGEASIAWTLAGMLFLLLAALAIPDTTPKNGPDPEGERRRQDPRRDA